MTDDIDIYRAANEFIMRYGDDADTQANMMADKMMARGGMEARAMWLRVLEAIGELRVLKRERVH
jgi:hypothetical protein